MTVKTFTAQVPALSATGTAFTLTAAGADGDTMPVSDTMRTLVVIANSDSDAHSVTFQSNPDEWGNTGTGVDKVITVPGTAGDPTVVIVGPLMPNRFANAEGACVLTYDAGVADMSIGVVNVPNASL